MNVSQASACMFLLLSACSQRNRAPAPVSIEPWSGTGWSQTFDLSYRDPNGSADLADVRVLFNRALDGVSSCYVHWNPLEKSLRLVDDTGYGSAAAQGTGIENSQCRVDTVEPIKAENSDTVTLRVSITFKPAFAGSKNVYMFAQDRGGLNSNLRKLGVWVIPNKADQ